MIKINNRDIDAQISIKREINENNEVSNIEGILLTNCYIEEIKAIETNNFVVSGIKVYEENFGSDDDNVMYKIKASDIKLKLKKIDEGFYQYI